MSSTLLELTRANHEDIERFMEAVVIELDQDTPRNFRESAFQNFFVNNFIEQTIDSAKKLAEIYEDKDGTRREEISTMSGQGPNLYSLFYDRLREIKEYHRKFPDLPVDRPEEHIWVDEGEVFSQFSGEESYGKNLDLHELYEIFVNLKAGKQVDYLHYVDIFFFFNDEFELKDEEYMKYIQNLLEYLKSFIRKSQPLFELEKTLEDIQANFENSWNLGEFQGWTQNSSMDAEISNHLYCKDCEKEFSKETVFRSHFSGKKHKRAAQRRQEKEKEKKELYRIEYTINALCNSVLQEQISNTKIHIEAKQSKTYKEIEKELENEEKIEESEDEEEEPEIKMTIDNYPIGWDGKPIPYWLYKLHGLGVEYKCEICGNHSYWGRKAYEQHFQEWRHAHGMRCLGIPNSKHFHDITKINDAIALWEKIKHDAREKSWKPDYEEEYEDNEGNVFNKKTYHDLRRQGLIQNL